MTTFRRAGWILAALLAGLAAPARETRLGEPYGTDLAWTTPSCEMVTDPVHRELRPVRAGHRAEVTYKFRAIGLNPSLRLRYQARLTRPGDQLGWWVSWDNERFAPAAEQTWQHGPQTLDLDRFLAADRPLYVRLSLLASQRPSDVAAAELEWLADGVERVPPSDPRLPRGVWLEPAWAAAEAGRWLQPLPAGEVAELGDGRLSLALRGRRAAGVWLTDALAGPLLGGGRTRLLRAATGQAGGSLWIDQLEIAGHALPGIAVGGAVPAGLATRGSGAAVAARGLPDGETVAWLETGPLELRHLELRQRFVDEGCELTGALTIINHAEQPIHAQVSLAVTGAEVLPSPQRIGCEVPPGPWLLPVRLFLSQPREWLLDGTVYRVAAAIDDGQQISDQLSWPVAVGPAPAGRERCATLAEAIEVGGVWITPLPVARADLELAAARRVPVVIQVVGAAQALAAGLEHRLRPPVVAVEAVP